MYVNKQDIQRKKKYYVYKIQCLKSQSKKNEKAAKFIAF